MTRPDISVVRDCTVPGMSFGRPVWTEALLHPVMDLVLKLVLPYGKSDGVSSGRKTNERSNRVAFKIEGVVPPNYH
jgi:hypothetical protein